MEGARSTQELADGAGPEAPGGKEERKRRAAEAMRGLSEDERKEVTEAVLGPPNKRVTNTIWLVVVYTMVAVVLVSLGAVIWFVGKDQLAPAVLSSVLTLTLGYLVGFLHPSPLSQD